MSEERDKRLNREAEELMVAQERLIRDEPPDYTGFVWKPASILPTPNEREGWAHRWVRTVAQNRADTQNISAKMRQGWYPVRREDYPEITGICDADGRFAGAGIEMSGMVLCRRPIEISRQAQAHYAKVQADQMRSVESQYKTEAKSGFSQRKSSVSRSPIS